MSDISDDESRTRTLRFGHLYGPHGWIAPGYVRVADDGSIASVSETPSGGAGETFSLEGYALPGMPNLHSHAFHRALAGYAEPRGGAARTFWSWRDRMYELALRLTPDDLEAVAAEAFLEMLKAGYTSVAEFHYLHHAPDGTRYDNRAELAERLIGAAASVGLGLTLLPALYMHGGLETPLEDRQRRFGSVSTDEFLTLVSSIRHSARNAGLVAVGVAPHSLRAVAEPELHALLVGLTDVAPDARVHMHLAEQRAEVEAFQARYGERPGEWLTNRFELGPRWTLIHATHCEAHELQAIARAGATIGLCPLTEAHLGDGIFELNAFAAAGGFWGVGTDANTAIGVAPELQMLEYGQRLAHQNRAVHPESDGPVGELLYRSAVTGGGVALGQPCGALEAGRRADLIYFEPDAPGLVGHGPETLLDAWLVAGGSATPNRVMVGGDWIVQDRTHPREAEIGRQFQATMHRLNARA